MSAKRDLLTAGLICELLFLIVALVACAPPVPGYPGPAVPTQASATQAPIRRPWTTDQSPIITPPTSEKIRVGPITSGAAKQPQLPYTHRTEVGSNSLSQGYYNQAFVTVGGHEVRLGDDGGDSVVEATTDKYVVWRFYNRTGSVFGSGLYIYDVRAGKNIRVGAGTRVGLSRIGGDWMVYSSWDGPQPLSGQLTMDDMPSDKYTGLVLAYDIATNTTLTLTEKLPIIRNRFNKSFYGVNGVQAGWIEYDVTTKTYSIKLMDLSTGTTRTLPVKPKQPRFLSMSRDLLVWRDTYWHGYSMFKDQFFTIPYAPVALENKPGIIVTAKDTAVEWSYTANAHDYVRFTAPIITK